MTAVSVRAAGVGISAPRSLTPAVRQALHGRLSPAALERRLAAVRARRLDLHERPGPGLAPVTAVVGDVALATPLHDAAAMLGLAPRGATHAERVLASLRANTLPRPVPEAEPLAEHLLVALAEARTRGMVARAVLPGPVSLALRLGGAPDALAAPFLALATRLVAAGADGLQLDEPALAGPLGAAATTALRTVYARLREVVGPTTTIVLTAVPKALAPANVALAARLPVDVLHLARPDLLAPAVAERRARTRLAVGLDLADHDAARRLRDLAVAAVGAEAIELAPAALPDEPDARPHLARLAALARRDTPAHRPARPRPTPVGALDA
ncbi:MAG TPA: hypothetical protein VFG42_14805 [Baekduia sp.]|uniref:hypothetical protein n=1 Tax=Baekduia sp. TaxID=2600305 RepID=UPI002D7864FC|nr:hypothetical protein [Baekduia sp.]HET6508058.1 hypothetical protein [Baekduia sp.]